MTKTLSLDQVEVHFDPKTATIGITSKDPRLATADSFKLTLSAQTESYRTLLKLLVSEGLADISEVEIPNSLRTDSGRELWVPGSNPQTHIVLGKGLGNRTIAVDLSLNLLIAGSTGSGKSIVMRNVICSALENSKTDIWAIDLTRIELVGYRYRASDRFASTQDETLMMLQDLMRELESRYETLKALGANSYLDTYLKSIYLVIDDLALLITQSEDPSESMQNAKTVEISELLMSIARIGRAGGVHIISGVKRAGTISPELRMQFTNKVLMGRNLSEEPKLLFGAAAAYGGAYLEPRGRGILEVKGEQTLFQSYYIGYDRYRNRLLSD